MSDKESKMSYTWWQCSDLIVKIEEDTELVAKATEICTELCNKTINITEVVEKLGPLLTAENTSHRARAMDLFSEILKHLAMDFLSESQLKFIVIFYRDRIQDHHSVAPAILAGTLAITEMINIPEDEFLRLFLAVMSGEIACQTQLRADREIFYRIIERTVMRFEGKLTTRKDEFFQGLIGAVEGERDPRCLLLIFTFMPRIIELYPLDHWTEEMFEVFACYFPVDFYPPPGQPDPISRDQLADNLLLCLTATASFVPLCLPLAAEKIGSFLKESKHDCLELIKKCAVVYGAEPFEEHFSNLWLNMKAEVLPGLPQHKEATVNTLETLSTIFFAASTSKELTENLLSVILHTITISLCDTNVRLFEPSCRIVLICCRSNHHAALTITNKLLPMFMAQLEEEDKPNDKKKLVLIIVSDIVRICREQKVLRELDEGIRKKFLDIYVNCFCYDVEYTEIGLQGLSEMAELLESSHSDALFGKLLENLQKGTDIELYDVIRRLVAGQEVKMMEIVDKLLQKDVLNAQNSYIIFKCTTILLTMGKASDRLTKFLLDNCFLESSGVIQLTALLALQELLTALETAATFIAKQEILEKFWIFLQKPHIKVSFENLIIFSEILKLAISSLPECEQKTAVEKYLPDLTPHKINELFLIDGLLGKLSPAVDISSHFHQITKDLIEFTVEISRGETSSSSSQHQEICDKLLCSLFNRTIQDSVFEETLCQSINYLNRQIEVSSLGVRTFAWIAKGLLIKGHRKTPGIVKDLVEMLSKDNLQTETVEAFRILARCPEDLTLAHVRPFHQQKLFELVHRNLTTDEKYSPCQLEALAEILFNLPLKAVAINLSRIGQIFFQCLDSNISSALLTTLTLINRLLQDGSGKDFCKYHLQTLVPRCVHLSGFRDSMKVRIAALEFLYEITKQYEPVLLIPFKDDVSFGLQSVLDDRKRLVRTAAVRTRNVWFVFDAKDTNK
ncbi:MMS19 nucleotide excision repair protein [Sergentomyia squamirostris]